jgi:hypothetical protein
MKLTAKNKKFIKNSRNVMDYDDMVQILFGFMSYDSDTTFTDKQIANIKQQVDDYIDILDNQDTE